jgi:hypothetical protein
VISTGRYNIDIVNELDALVNIDLETYKPNADFTKYYNWNLRLFAN